MLSVFDLDLLLFSYPFAVDPGLLDVLDLFEACNEGALREQEIHLFQGLSSGLRAQKENKGNGQQVTA